LTTTLLRESRPFDVWKLLDVVNENLFAGRGTRSRRSTIAARDLAAPADACITASRTDPLWPAPTYLLPAQGIVRHLNVKEAHLLTRLYLETPGAR